MTLAKAVSDCLFLLILLTNILTLKAFRQPTHGGFGAMGAMAHALHSANTLPCDAYDPRLSAPFFGVAGGWRMNNGGAA